MKTAEQFLEDYDQEYYPGEVFGAFAYEQKTVLEVMKDFALYHVQSALREAVEKADLTMKKKSNFGKNRKWQNVKEEEEVDIFSYEIQTFIDKSSILNAYSLDNIK